MYTIATATRDDDRPLEEILDEINGVSSFLPYCEHRMIQEDLCTILERYRDAVSKHEVKQAICDTCSGTDMNQFCESCILMDAIGRCPDITMKESVLR